MTDFATFLRAARGRDPYPWQQAYAHRVVTGAVPEYVTAPTGSGKTTVLDATIWALAHQADRRPTDRTVGVRSIWAIDRRLLVDDVFEQATELAKKLEDALRDPQAVLHNIARRLLSLAASGTAELLVDIDEACEAGHRPLLAHRWRGGIADRMDRQSPYQPQIITSTVQQAGSRLLFRGYGVAQRSWSIEAALLGCDATIFLDEAHLAAPFAETVAAVIKHQAERPAEHLSLPPALRLVTLTATPPAEVMADPARAHGISPDDRVMPSLKARLEGTKTLRTAEAEPGPAKAQLASLVMAELESDPAAVVAVVVNKVRTARDVFDELNRRFKGSDAPPRFALLIGPQRPADRREQLDQEVRVALSLSPAPDSWSGRAVRPVVVVATQTFEVGLDADVSCLITQSASVSALVQRLGRLNRAGLRERAIAVVVRDEGFPLYADDEEAAWNWLKEEIEAKRDGDASVRSVTEAPRPQQRKLGGAPTLTDSVVHDLAQTSVPLGTYAEPDVQGLLRGVQEKLVAEVSVVWRADLLPERADTKSVSRRLNLLRLAPPQRDEILTLPIAVVRGLLAGDRSMLRAAAEAPDFDAEESRAPESRKDRWRFVVLRAGNQIIEGTNDAAADGETILGPKHLRPGDTVVLPTEVGGIDEGGLSALAAVANERSPELDAVAEGKARLPFRITAQWLGVDPSTVVLAERAVPQRSAEAARHWRDVIAVLANVGPNGRFVGSTREDGTNESPEVAFRRLTRALVELRAPAPADAVSSEEDAEPEAVRPDRLAAALPGIAGTTAEDWVVRVLQSATAADDPRRPSPFHRGWVLVPRRGRRGDLDHEQTFRAGGVDGSEPPTIEAHCSAVARRATGWAAPLELPPAVAAAVGLAAQAHDLGKADPRTQAWFWGGRRRLGAAPIAKSVFGLDDRAFGRRARQLAGAPSRLRHEADSVMILRSAAEAGTLPDELSHADLRLALHLVGSHHGWGRPWFDGPPIGGAPAQAYAVDLCGIRGQGVGDGTAHAGGWVEEFARLHDRFGPWQLAYLEVLVRLADRTVSTEGR